jgi:hypothetical protein
MQSISYWNNKRKVKYSAYFLLLFTDLHPINTETFNRRSNYKNYWTVPIKLFVVCWWPRKIEWMFFCSSTYRWWILLQCNIQILSKVFNFFNSESLNNAFKITHTVYRYRSRRFLNPQYCSEICSRKRMILILLDSIFFLYFVFK